MAQALSMKAACPKSFWKKDGKDSKPVQPNSILVHLVLVSVQVRVQVLLFYVHCVVVVPYSANI